GNTVPVTYCGTECPELILKAEVVNGIHALHPRQWKTGRTIHASHNQYGKMAVVNAGEGGSDRHYVLEEDL
ncbi:hypothetical protein AVEN_189044-1, partial [Araneus ventricosus]